MNGEMDTTRSEKFRPDVTVDTASTEFLESLERALVKKNREYSKDKSYQRMRTGPVTLSYPANILTFGREYPDQSIVAWSSGGLFVAAKASTLSEHPSEVEGKKESDDG